MKKYLCMMLALLAVCVSLGGCTIETEDAGNAKTESGYYFYYVNSDETELCKEVYTPAEEDASYMVKDLMQRLGKKAKEGEEINLLPDEVSINSYDLQKNSLVIDFNAKYNDMSRAREILVRAGTVKTFLQIPEIETIRFTVNGEDLLDSRNQAMGDMTEDTFVEYSGKDMDAYRYDTFTLYFTDKSGQNLVAEKRNVYYKRSLTKERVVLEQLAKGPMVKGNYPTIPGNTMALSVTTADDVCYVNLDRNFQVYALDIAEAVPVYSIVNSLVDACDAEKVQISVESDTDGNFRDSMPLYRFYEKNEEMVLPAEEPQE